jgi:hypothetical protein
MQLISLVRSPLRARCKRQQYFEVVDCDTLSARHGPRQCCASSSGPGLLWLTFLLVPKEPRVVPARKLLGEPKDFSVSPRLCAQGGTGRSTHCN